MALVRPRGIVMGYTGSGKTWLLRYMHPTYAILYKGLDVLSGTDVAFGPAKNKFHLGTKQASGRPLNAWLWFQKHVEMLESVMIDRSKLDDPKARKRIAGKIAPGWTIPEPGVPGILISEFSQILKTIQLDNIEKEGDKAFGKNYGMVQDLIYSYREIFAEYGLGLWFEMQVDNEHTKVNMKTKEERHVERGPLTPSIGFRSALPAHSSFCWEVESFWDPDLGQAQRNLLTMRQEGNPYLKSRLNFPGVVNLVDEDILDHMKAAGMARG